MSDAYSIPDVPSKDDAPRYYPGINEYDDDLSGQEWAFTMGPIPADITLAAQQ